LDQWVCCFLDPVPAAERWEIAVPIVKDYPVYNFKTEVRLTIDF
jgi:hypothetical protein